MYVLDAYEAYFTKHFVDCYEFLTRGDCGPAAYAATD